MRLYKFSLFLLLAVSWTDISYGQTESTGRAALDEIVCVETIPPNLPFWNDPKAVAKISPCAENEGISKWLSDFEQELTKSLLETHAWNSAFENSRAFFFVDKTGKIQDPVFLDEEVRKAFLHRFLAKFHLRAVPPDKLRGRRFMAKFNYPNLSILVDYNEPTKDRAWFEQWKSPPNKSIGRF